MSSNISRTVKMYGLGRALAGGATRFEKSSSEYNAKMKYLSDSIFVDFKKPIDTKPNKKLYHSLICRPYYDRPELVKYYPAHEEINRLMTKLRDYGLYRDVHKDFVDEMERLRILRGKPRRTRERKKGKK